MGTHLSPFRYIQLCRHIVHKAIEAAPISSRKGKARAVPPQRRPVPHIVDSVSRRGMVSAAVEERGPDTAGPSTWRRDQPSLDPSLPPAPSELYRLMNDERLLIPGAVKPPKEIVVLCHGLYGFSTATPIPLFPSLKLHYWGSVLDVLRDRMGVKVVVVGVNGTGSIKERAEQMHAFLKDYLPKGVGVNFVAHSMGGLDARHLISTIKPTEYTPLSLTTIGTPHRGSPFMDWCAANIGVGSAAAVASAAMGAEAAKLLPFSLRAPLLARVAETASPDKNVGGLSGFGFGGFTTAFTSYLLKLFDSPAYSNLTTSFLRDFNPQTPDSPSVKYTSVAGRLSKMSVLHPLWFSKLVLDAAGERGYPEEYERQDKGYEGNDGLVSVSSAKWGEFVGVVDECHHWDLRGEGGLWPNGGTTTVKPEGKPDKSMPGGWDWQGGQGKGVGDELGLTTGPGEDRRDQHSAVDSRNTANASDVGEKEKSALPGKAGTSWDIAQVGQVIDWVTDLLPGGERTETGKKQLADARREKEKEESRGLGGVSADGAGAETEKERERQKRKKEKFELARFYGGLMLKLREDGF